MDEEKSFYFALANAMNNGDADKVKKLKYDVLYYGRGLLDVVINYMALVKFNVDFDYGFQLLKKGTKLYRIRKYIDNVDFSNLKEWDYPPHTPENRANTKGEPALYLATMEEVCILETQLKPHEKYVLGEYEVCDDLFLGGFLNCEDYKSSDAYLAGVILNAFLIAPSRSDKNLQLFEYIDNKYKGLDPWDVKMKNAKDLDLPLKFAFINKKNEFYKVTNKLLENIKSKYHDGIIYSSCYLPISTVGIKSNAQNVVLYKDGMNKIKFKSHVIKTNECKVNGLDTIKLLINGKID